MTKHLLATILIATLAVAGTAAADAPTCCTIEGVGLEPDVVGVVNEVRILLVDPDGTPVSIALRGYTGDPMTMPPLEAWFDPDFVPADADVPFHGAAWLQTMAPQYAFVNHTVFAATGSINHATSQIRVTYCAIAP